MRKKYLSALLFGALLVTSAGTFTSCKDYDDEINGLQEQITANADAIKKLQEMIGDGKFVTNIVSEGNGLKITWNDNQSTVIENVINGEDQKGDVVTIDPETGEIKINDKGTGFFASKGESEEEVKLPYVNEDGILVLIDEEGKEVVTGIRVSPVTAVIHEDGSADITIIGADGKPQVVKVPSAASVMRDLELVGWANVSDATADLSQKDDIKYGDLEAQYAHVTFIHLDGETEETTWSAQKEVKKGQVLTTLAANNTKLVTRVSPADLDLSQMSFTLQDSKGNKLPVSLGKAEAFTGTLTRTASGLSFIPMDVTSDTYTAEQVTDLFPANNKTVYSLVEASGARSTYAEFNFNFSPATVDKQEVNKVGGKAIENGNFEVDLNKANKLEFTGNGVVYDYYVEPADKAICDLFGVTIDKSNGTFTVTKLADPISSATFDLNVYALHLNGTIYKSTITIKPSRKMVGVATIAAGDQIIKQVVDNNGNEVDAYADKMAFVVSLDDMFAALSDEDKAKWASAKLGAKDYEITSAKVGNDDETTTLFKLEALKADGTSTNNWYEAKNVLVVTKYSKTNSTTNKEEATLSVGKEYTISVDFKNDANPVEVLNTVKITFTPTLPELSSYMVKHPSFWDGNKLMGIAQASNIAANATSEILSYNIVDAFKTLGSEKDADNLAVKFELADNKVDDKVFVELDETNNSLVKYSSGKSASKQYGKEFTVKVKSASYLGVYNYDETTRNAQAFKMVVLDPVYEGEIKPVEGTALEVFATAGAKLSMADLIGYNYNKQTYNLYMDVNDEGALSADNSDDANDFAYTPIVKVTVESGDKKVFDVVETDGEPTPATWDEVAKKVVPGYVTISTKEISNDTETTIKVKVIDVWGYEKVVEIPLTIKMAE